MGRKRKAGSIPSPLVASLPAVARPESSAGRRKKKSSRAGGRRCARREHGPTAPPQTAQRTTPTAPTGSSLPPVAQPGPTSASCPLDGAIQALLSPPPPLQAPASTGQAGEDSTSNGARASSMYEDEPGKSHGDAAELGLTPSNVIGLLPASGWRLGSCWGAECGCVAFKPLHSTAVTPPGCCRPHAGVRLWTPKRCSRAGRCERRRRRRVIAAESTATAVWVRWRRPTIRECD